MLTCVALKNLIIYYVRIDILERLFMLIINSPNSEENKEIKIST